MKFVTVTRFETQLWVAEDMYDLVTYHLDDSTLRDILSITKLPETDDNDVY